MPYVHLANGDVEHVTDEELAKSREESGTPNAFHKNGKQHHVIGVYPDEVDAQTDEEKAQAAEAEANERAEFEEWKSTRKESSE